MSKKICFLSLILLLVCFSAGIFTEIALSAGTSRVSVQLPKAAGAVAAYIRSDLLTVFSAMLFSASVFLLPLVPLTVIGKTFSLGFSAAYILSSSSEKALFILTAALLPRGIFKIPAYIGLVLISLETAAFVKRNFQNLQVLKQEAPRHLIRFLFCFLVLAASSALEAFLLSAVL